MKRIIIPAFLLVVSTVLFAGPSREKGVTETVVKIGVVGEYNDYWNPVIEELAKEGVRIELVRFSEYVQPNRALEDGEIDLNSFQHYAYLNNEIKTKGYKLSPIGETVLAPLGLYSRKIKSVAEIKNGDKIAIPNDTVNGGRALRVLEKAGLITIPESAGPTPNLSDITANPRNIQFIEVEAAQTPRLLDDVTASVINGGHAVDAGLNPERDSLALERQAEGSQNPYINLVAARTADKDNPLYLKIVEVLHTEPVRQVILKTYKGALIPAF
ncbi:MAG: MetQ/NlpA family ABC transporter substrate-binding protein [Spirochaetaceae bacterium]|jgi:D-methionine transport system substrate-binding protein|nr:MetQ/NlpA family ABC transporter substrate-binding protein [Spirochaetaceae bacterium]